MVDLRINHTFGCGLLIEKKLICKIYCLKYPSSHPNVFLSKDELNRKTCF